AQTGCRAHIAKRSEAGRAAGHRPRSRLGPPMAIVHQGLDAVALRQLALVLGSVPPRELGEEMADILIGSIPEFERSSDEDFREGTILSCESNVSSVWEQLL